LFIFVTVCENGWARAATLMEEVAHSLIFLDIDGVLNNRLTVGDIDERKLALLRKLVDATHADIVLSSMWRLTKLSRQQVKNALRRAGLPRPISYTPCMDNGHARTAEILWWLRENTDALGDTVVLEPRDMQQGPSFGPRHYTLEQRLHVTHFVALDDLDLRKPRRGGGTLNSLLTHGHFVRTAGTIGLTDANVAQAQDLLTRDSHKAATTASRLEASTLFGSHETATEDQHLLPAARCEQCGQGAPRVEDRTINKFFCRSACWRDFYAQHGVIAEQL